MGKGKIVYRVVRTRDEIEQCFSLVYKEYLRKGYIPKNYKSKLRLSFFNALPSTATFIAKQDKKVLAGVTLIPDSRLGLPMDKIYKKELDELRNTGARIAEVSQLAIDTTLFGTGLFSMFNFSKLIFILRLFRLVLHYALDVENLTHICIAINPKQECLYKFLFFEQIGGLKYYGSVNKAPAIALKLELDGLEEKGRARRGLYKIFYGSKIKPKLFEGKLRLSSQDLKYFFVKKSDIFKNANREQLDYLRSCHASESFHKVFRRKFLSKY